MWTGGDYIKIDQPTDWVRSMAITEIDNGQHRICLDRYPRDLNRAIKRHQHPMPTVDEALAKLGGAIIFSKLDAACGYRQIKVDEESVSRSINHLDVIASNDHRSESIAQQKSSKTKWHRSLMVSKTPQMTKTT